MGVRMDLAAIVACVAGALVALGQGEWVWGIALAALAIVGLVLVVSAGRKRYIHFIPDPAMPPSSLSLSILEPDTKLSVRASGDFAIRDQVRCLAEHRAILTTPRSREHVLMAYLQRSRLLLFGQSRPSEWGWWYQFIPAAAITQVEFGTVIHGWEPRLALRLCYRIQDEQENEKIIETTLSFDDKEMLILAWTDLSREKRERATTGQL